MSDGSMVSDKPAASDHHGARAGETDDEHGKENKLGDDEEK